MPIHPLLRTTSWICNICQLKLNCTKIQRIHQILISLITGDDLKQGKIKNILEFTRNKLPTLIPWCNQYAIELKLQIILHVTNDTEDRPRNEYLFEIKDFQEKEKYCLEILNIMEKIRLGECFIKGTIYYELYKCRRELYRTEIMPQVCKYN